METTMNEKIVSIKVQSEYIGGLNDYYEKGKHHDSEEEQLYEIEIITDKETKISVTHDSGIFGVTNLLERSEGDMPMIGDTLYAVEIEGCFLKLKTNKGYTTFTVYSRQGGYWYSQDMELTITKNGNKIVDYITGELDIV